MNPNENPADDSYWSSLAEELDVKPTVGKSELRLEELPDATDNDEDTLVIPTLQAEPIAEVESDLEDGASDDEGSEESAADAAADGDTAPEGETEPERKKRRRRRRRKKGSGSDPEIELAPVAVATAVTVDDSNEDFIEQGGEMVPAAAEELPADFAQEVIANWDVPSWDEIIRGLYRPGR